MHFTISLHEIDGVMYISSDKFNQDPLEEHFGRQRIESITPLSKITDIIREK